MTGLFSFLANPWWALATITAIGLLSLALFLYRHPVDGDIRVMAAADRYTWFGAIFVGVVLFAATPSPWVLAPLLGVCLWAVHFKSEELELAHQTR